MHCVSDLCVGVAFKIPVDTVTGALHDGLLHIGETRAALDGGTSTQQKGSRTCDTSSKEMLPHGCPPCSAWSGLAAGFLGARLAGKVAGTVAGVQRGADGAAFSPGR